MSIFYLVVKQLKMFAHEMASVRFKLKRKYHSGPTERIEKWGAKS